MHQTTRNWMYITPNAGLGINYSLLYVLRSC